MNPEKIDLNANCTLSFVMYYISISNELFSEVVISSFLLMRRFFFLSWWLLISSHQTFLRISSYRRIITFICIHLHRNSIFLVMLQVSTAV